MTRAKIVGHDHDDVRLVPPDLSAQVILEQKLVGSVSLPTTFYVRVRLHIQDGVPVVQHERAGCRLTG
ncbi:MAG TPA: hypothetical protein VFM93_14500 [Candidatus Limnocylindria bacterium]|nr:hypothetical protein [Candidatus Limnocylindria bacterium]